MHFDELQRPSLTRKISQLCCKVKFKQMFTIKMATKIHYLNKEVTFNLKS